MYSPEAVKAQEKWDRELEVHSQEFEKRQEAEKERQKVLAEERKAERKAEKEDQARRDKEYQAMTPKQRAEEASIAMESVTFAIEIMEGIPDDDILRVKALKKVKTWVQGQLERKE